MAIISISAQAIISQRLKMDRVPQERKVLCIGGSYFNRVKSELEKLGFRFIFLTNVQLLYAEQLPPRKREMKRNFFNSLRNELDKETLILLNLSGNSLFLNRCRQNHHNPESEIGFDQDKIGSYQQDMIRLIGFLISNLKRKGLSWEELKERIVILPTSPRFIYTCCENENHHTQDMKTIHDTITNLQLQLKNHFTTRNISLVKVIPLRNWINFILLNLDIEKIFCDDMEFLRDLCKKSYEYSFRNLGGNKKAQKIILRYVLDMEKDNGLHIKAEYNNLWITYLLCLTQPDYSPNPPAMKKLLTLYRKLKYGN